MLLLDQKVTLIQVSVYHFPTSSERRCNLQDLMRGSNTEFKFSDSRVSIHFTNYTNFVERTESGASIPLELFTFRDYAALVSLPNTNTQLPGDVSSSSITRLNLHFQINICLHNLYSDTNISTTVNLCVYNTQADRLKEKLLAMGVPKVVVAISINSKFVRGSLSVDATHGTHLYFDDETRASETFVASFPDHHFDSSTSPPKKGSVKKIEAVHVSELNTYVTNSPPQCGEADSYFSNLLNFFPTYLVDHLRRYLIYALLLSDEAMTIQHTGNKNTKPLNVSPNLTTGLPSTDIARFKSERLRDHGEEGTNAVSYEPAADKTRHQGEMLR
ncbi:BnaC09g53280D [Brassica napus]|uniref:(rape) hypothetical protein n=1 Tax=Brassica napus TaxID=3708 RepID=A0A078JH75_BRANA|nr:unnamed protein product [Brassica napus]CDY65056.1 BnaC09g53280D [Brassica napus]